MTTADRAELAALRRRAYGPAGDIHTDPAALARLAELEAALRATTTVRVAMPSARVERSIADPPSPAVPVHEPDIEVAGPAAARSWRRMRRSLRLRSVIVAAAVGVTAGALAVAAAGALAAPRPQATLTAIDATLPSDSGILSDETLRFFGLNREAVTNFGQYRTLQVIAGPTDAGTRCLIVSGPADATPGWGCAEPGRDAVATIVMSRSAEKLDGAPFPAGSVIRFELHGDRVQVFEHAAPAPTQSP